MNNQSTNYNKFRETVLSKVFFHRMRGKSLGYPPNSILGLEWCLEFGCRNIEYDILYCERDGRGDVVVIEPNLVKERGLDPNKLKWEDIKDINTGNEKSGLRRAQSNQVCSAVSIKIVLSALSLQNISQQIHIKNNFAGPIVELVEILSSELESLQNFHLTHFDLRVLEKIKSLNPNLPLGWIVKPQQESGGEGLQDLTALVSSGSEFLKPYTDDEIDDIVDKAKEIGIDLIILCGPRIFDKGSIDLVRSNGFQVGAWGTGENIKIAKRLIEFDIDRFTLDNPEELLNDLGLSPRSNS
jgi:glycerophosphoryl diester phosphodiesterase